MDSLMAVEIALAIQDYMGIRFQPTLLLELQSMTELMAHLEALMKQEEHP
jgi:acyl carrier protein